MKFELIRLLHKIKELYKLPRGKERFEKYLFMLQGDTKKEIILPIAGFNPMGKDLAIQKLDRLIQLNAEDIAANELSKINKVLQSNHKRVIRVGLNLMDDVEGSWSHYYTTDYKSKFESGSLLRRNFCTPVFWTSESVTEEIIIQRAKEYVFRSVFCLENGNAETLRDLFEQEVYVYTQIDDDQTGVNNLEFSDLQAFYSDNHQSKDYTLKFNFFYGDEASRQLEYFCCGIGENGGFEFSKHTAKERRKASDLHQGNKN